MAATRRHQLLDVWGPRLLGLLAVFAALNLVAALVGPQLSDPLEFGRPIAQVKYDHLQELVAEDGCIDIVAAGDSLAGFAVDPQILESAFPGLDAYNVALTGSVASIDADWLHDVVVPTVDPSTVLLVPSPLTFAPDTPLASRELEDWAQAPATRDGVIGAADRTAADWLPLVRYRTRLTDPEEWGRLLRGEESLDLFRDTFEQTPDDIRAAAGQVESDRTFAPDTPAGRLTIQGTEEQILAGWSIDPDQVDALRASTQRLLDEGRTVVYVLPPVTEQFVAGLPDGADDLAAWRSTVQGLATELGVPVVDGSAPQPPAKFLDTHHLNQRGATAFTEAIVAGLRSQGITPTPCSPR